ncbi:bifunctional DNA primase/polymerase [Microcoleus vaginatus]|uniref:bifunctional DNA primase/polymerase n=1 Tax=Microcoleus vaginatus TaxID=119532 RepID=UPI0032A92C63
MTLQSKLHYLDRFNQDCISPEIPYTWPLVPVCGKRAYEEKWTQKSYSHPEILAELQTGRATGVGLKLGNGLLAIDIDGESATEMLAKLAGSNSLAIFSETTAWSSGRAGRKQCLFSVPEASWHRLHNLSIPTGIIGDDGKKERLEFHWRGRQSVLPPSLHPETNKPYIWLNNPVNNPPLPAPEWLIEVCENWHSEYVNSEEPDLVRFPVRLLKHFGHQMWIWLLARRFDLSRRSPGGKPKGCGKGQFNITAAARILNRSAGHIRKLLCAAKNSGLIRDYLQRGNWVTVYYTSLERAIAIAGIDKLGPIAAIKIDELSCLNIIATEIEAQYLQRASFHRQRQEEMRQIKAEGSDLQQPTQLIGPTALHTCEKPARVLGKSDRFIYVEPGFRFYGGSIEAIAQLRGLSPATVSRHLSNSYRLVASPVRVFREELPPLVKKQVMERLPLPKNIPAKLCREEGLISMLGEWWKPHCNIYVLNHRLVSARRRRSRIQTAIDKRALCVKIESPRDLEKT